MNRKRKGGFRDIGFYVVLFIIAIGIFVLFSQTGKPQMIPYSEVVDLFEKEQVESFLLDGDTLTLQLKDMTVVSHELYSSSIFYNDLGDLINKQRTAGTLSEYDYNVGFVAPWWMMILPYVGVVVVMGILWMVMMNRTGGGEKAMRFGKARTRLGSDEKRKVTFNDVAGADEEKEELQEIVDFLKNPKRYIDIGARIPKGVLLVGPPGTGKTLLAKAVAGEAGVQFLSISGSDFVELYVGIGASRVRDLFEQAKKSAPSIVFIDEIDAVGRHRGAGMGGGHDEREQTLNQLLVEMDGFGSNEGVIIIAATNRPDILDPALLRPGRFDRQVRVGLPDIKGREAILRVHSRGKPLDANVNLATIAKTTGGFSGADLENLMNEAALLTARKRKIVISMEEIEEAIIKVVAGPQKKSRIMPEKEKRLTAYHEAGHAVVTKMMPTQDPVHQISIIPRGGMGGYTMSLPTEDKFYASRMGMYEEIVVLLGGRVAEKLTQDDISTGASNDLQRATKIAREMVTRYGMSDELGPVAFASDNDEVFLGLSYGHTQNYSDETAAEIDREIRKIINTAYAQCQKILTEQHEPLVRVAEYLIENETLEGDDFEKVFAGNLLQEETGTESPDQE